MLDTCCICTLQSQENFPTATAIVETLQVVIKLLKDKENHDHSKLMKIQESLENANQCNNDLKLANQKLSADVERLNGMFEVAQSRSNNYKQKFLQIQQNLIQLHKTNKKLKSAQGDSQQCKAFPFKSEHVPEEKTSVVLAPDTCFADSPPPNILNEEKTTLDSTIAKNSSFNKPPRNKSILNFFEITKSKKKEALLSDKPEQLSPNIKKTNYDPDETRVDQVFFFENDDKELSIPSSPVLSGKLNAARKQDCHKENLDETKDSPSLLKSVKSFKVPLHVDQSVKNKIPNIEDTCNIPKKNLFHNDSFTIHSRSNIRSISPIQVKESQPHEGDCSLNQDELCTSIDELFNKTDGILPGDITANKIDDPEVVFDDDGENNDNDHHVIEERSPDSNLATTLSNQVPYKYQSVVRKRNERRRLNAETCPQCEAYYSDLSSDERAKIIQEVCRHRYQFAPPSTPNNFWEVGIPSTAECKRRGYILDEDDLPGDVQDYNRRRRKKPYQAHFPTKHD